MGEIYYEKLSDITLNKPKKKPNGYWNNYDRCFEESKKYKTRKDFKLGSSAAHKYSTINGWIYDFIPTTRRRYDTITIEDCINQALLCKNMTDFMDKNFGMYLTMCSNKWNDMVNDATNIRKTNQKNFLTKEECNAKSKLCDTKLEFKKKYPKEYYLSHKNKWLDMFGFEINERYECYYWDDYERCKDAASLFSKITPFRKKFPSAYNYSRINGWLCEFFPKKVK